MSARADLLLELGTEELPTKAQYELGKAFFEGMGARLGESGLAWDNGRARWYATPRRLAVSMPDLATQQPDDEEQRLGPAVTAALDSHGNPTPAAQGFARSCGVAVVDLQRVVTDKGERLGYTRQVVGRPTSELIPEIMAEVLRKLPIGKPMRWADYDFTFVRPVHWIVALLGEKVIEGEMFGLPFGRVSRGHRFHHGDSVWLSTGADYVGALETAKVIVEPERRRERVARLVTEAATSVGAQPLMRDSLLDEVVGLVEWPAAIIGTFSETFLTIPSEALVSSMENHQKFFPVVNHEGRLLAHFVGVANIESTYPEAVRQGYERVLGARLADARFFWDRDRKRPLSQYAKTLGKIVYQERLGTLADKCDRVQRLAISIADALAVDRGRIERAAALAKCDLVTEMVAEFPELQGIMGRYYALEEGADRAVAQAIEEHYRPRFAGDDLPTSRLGLVLGVADRLDTLASIFSVGLGPTGNRDPYALRRTALGLLRLLIEGTLEIDLHAWIGNALAGIAASIPKAKDLHESVFDFVMDRLRVYYTDQGVGNEVFAAVRALRPTSPLDFHQRLLACQTFRELAAAPALAAANKRIGNILKRARDTISRDVVPQAFNEPAEDALWTALQEAEHDTATLLERKAYAEVLLRLADLRAPVDLFFDHVMVMAEDTAQRQNRLALLSRIKGLFDAVADVAKLAVE